MKKLLSILCTGLLLCGAGLTSCENYDDPVTGNAYGNNSIPEGRTISIAALKEKYHNHQSQISERQRNTMISLIRVKIPIPLSRAKRVLKE